MVEWQMSRQKLALGTIAIVLTLAMSMGLVGAAMVQPRASEANLAIGSSVTSASLAPHGIGSVVATIPVGWGPGWVTFDKADNKIFVANGEAATTARPGNVTVINPASNTVSSWITLPVFTTSGGAAPDSLAYDSANGNLYVVDQDAFRVFVVNAATNAVGPNSVNLSGSAGSSGSLALDSTTGTLFMVSYDNLSMYTINTASNTLGTQFFSEPANSAGLETPMHECIDTANGELFVVDQSAYGPSVATDIAIDSATTYSFITNLSSPQGVEGGCAYDSTNGDIYVAGGNVTNVISGSTNKLVTNVSYSTQAGADGVVFDPANGYLYTTDYNTNSVTVIDGSTNTILGTIAVGVEPDAIEYDSTNGDIYVVNSANNNAAGTVSVINPAGGSAGGPVINSFTATPSSVAPGSAVTIAVGVTGGTAPYSFAYTGLPSSCLSQNLATISCVTTTPGTYSVSVTVTDSTGKTAASSAPAVFTVTAPAGYPQITAFSASPSSVAAGSSTTFTVSVSGGKSPYTYSYATLPAGCTSSNTSSLQCTPSTAGNYTVTVTVTDANKHSVNRATILTVTSGTSNGNGNNSNNGNNNLLIYVVVGVVVVAAVGGGLAYYFKAKKPKTPTNAGAPPPGNYPVSSSYGPAQGAPPPGQ